MTWGYYQQPQQQDPLDQLANAAGNGPVQYSTPAQYSRHSRHAPAYAWIRIGAGLLAALGIVLLLIGCFILMVGLTATASTARDGYGVAGGASMSIIMSVGFMAYGVMLLFIASCGMALRDIARNSFRW